MSDIAIGDVVFDELGIPCNVTNVTAVMENRRCYRLTFRDGTQVIADYDHEWWVHTASERDQEQRRVAARDNALRSGHLHGKEHRPIWATHQLYGMLEIEPSVSFAIRAINPLAGNTVEYPLHPFAVGLWLAQSAPNQQAWAGIEIDNRHWDTTHYLFDLGVEVSIGADSGRHLLPFDIARHLQFTHRIPSEFWGASFTQRLALMQGIAEIGYSISSQNVLTIWCGTKEFAEDVALLARTLSAFAKVSQSDHSGYYVYIKSNMELRRKPSKRTKSNAHNTYWHYITSIEPVESVPVRCIEVDSPSHLYLATEKLIPTSNSHLAAEKMHALCLRYPGSTGLILRKAREQCRASVVDFMRTVVIGRDRNILFRPSEYRWRYRNGSSLIWGGMRDPDQREAIRSIGQQGGLDWLWMEEATAFEEEDFNELLPRMRGRAVENYYLLRGFSQEEAYERGFRQMLLTCNPDHPYHWIKQRLIDGGEAKVYYSKADDNFWNPNDYSDSLNKLTGAQRLRLRDGKWVSATGMVYPEWDDSLHLIDRFPIPSEWPRFISVDFGYTHPFVALWGATDPDGRLYIYRQLYMTNRTTPVHAKTILTHTGRERIQAIICDHDSNQRALLESNGVEPTLKAFKDIEVGVQMVKQRLIMAGDGSPRLFVMRNSVVEIDQRQLIRHKPTSLEQEIYFYQYDKPSLRLGLKEQPKPVDNDACDALRYMITFIDGSFNVDIVDLSRIYEQESD